MKRITDIVEEKGGVITKEDITDKAEYWRILRAAKNGKLLRVRKGVYAVPSSLFNTMIDVDKIVPGGVVCLYNAWAFYQLCTTVPPAFCIAIEAKQKVRLSAQIPVNIYYWKKEYLEFGITEQDVSGYRIKMTDLERSVCDAIKYRNKIGVELTAEILRSYLKRNDRNMSRLTEYAQKLRIARILANYLEISME